MVSMPLVAKMASGGSGRLNSSNVSDSPELKLRNPHFTSSFLTGMPRSCKASI